MQIKQKINTNDIIDFNYYLLEKNVSFTLSTLVLGILSLVLGTASIIYELLTEGKVLVVTIIISTLLIVLGLFALIGLKPLLKWSVKKRIIKRNDKIEEILVTMNDAGLTWQYLEKQEDVTPYTWSSILKAESRKKHIYIHINQYIILFINKEACECVEEVEKYIESKLLNRYKKNNK